MAAANPQVPLEDCTSDLTKCGICKKTVNDPKALQCLHTFCLVCLKDWISGDNDSDVKSVVCPSCKKTTPLPTDEIEGLPGNFFVSSLMERSKFLTPGINTACVCCEEMGAELLATCSSCEGFLCKKGIELHKTIKLLKTHEVVSLGDLKAGAITNFSSIVAKQPACDIHEGKPLWLYCETCSELICGNCTFVEHKSPEHVYVELKSIATKQRKDIKKLVEKSSRINTKIIEILKNTKSAKVSLSSNAKQAALAIEKAVQTVIHQIRKLGKAEQDKLYDWVSDSEKELRNTEKKLLNHQSQLQRCEEMATQVLRTGSDYDVASIYKQLINSLGDVSSTQYPVPEPELESVMFKPTQAALNIETLGNLIFGARKVSSRNWVLEKEFVDRVKYPRGVAVTSSGDIAVANLDSSSPVHIYSKTGSLKQSLGKESTEAWNVAALDDRLFVTRWGKTRVATFNSAGTYLSEFSAVSPDGIKSDGKKKQLKGLAVDHQSNMLLVGGEYSNYISMHTCDGSHVRSIKSPIRPWYICTTTQGNIIVSDGWDERNVIVMDMSGNQLAAIKSPPSVAYWKPCGICVSQNDEICVTDWKNASVYCYTQTGQYISCVVKDLNQPTGIALIENDSKMIVAEWGRNAIKILKAK